jgi:hypothetical protein
MNRNWSVRSCAAIALPFCLSLWGLAAPVSAKTIVVTTTEDVVSPPFTADGLCGSGTIADLPNAGEISLREAVIAANNTPGAKTIKFASSLNGATIKLTRGLALCAFKGRVFTQREAVWDFLSVSYRHCSVATARARSELGGGGGD